MLWFLQLFTVHEAIKTVSEAFDCPNVLVDPPSFQISNKEAEQQLRNIVRRWTDLGHSLQEKEKQRFNQLKEGTELNERLQNITSIFNLSSKVETIRQWLAKLLMTLLQEEINGDSLFWDGSLLDQINALQGSVTTHSLGSLVKALTGCLEREVAKRKTARETIAISLQKFNWVEATWEDARKLRRAKFSAIKRIKRFIAIWPYFFVRGDEMIHS